MSGDCHLCFSPLSTFEAGSYKLLELTPDLTTLIEKAISNDENPRLTIKGETNEDAVLCTEQKTFNMRSIGLSNSVLVVTPVLDVFGSELFEDTVIIRDQLNEVIELIPAVPKLDKLFGLLKSRQYDEEQDEENELDIIKFTYDYAKAALQASDAELDNGLKNRRILIINNELRPISPSFLNHVLQLILNLLVSMSMNYTCAPIEDLLSALTDVHEISRSVSSQIMAWFGEIMEGKWKVNVHDVVKEIGLGILRNHRHDPIVLNDLLSQWKNQVGDSFLSSVSLNLLAGNYVEIDSFDSNSKILKFFPASELPVDPAARFSDLFLTRAKWKGEEILPFLSDIAVNSKEREKLLLKYCRTVTDSQGAKYTARVQYNR